MVLFPPLKETALGPVLQQSGILGMALFFSLSGFVICYNYADRINAAPLSGTRYFLAARCARLFPLYALFLGGWFVFNSLFGGQDINEFFACVIALPLYAVGAQSWVYGFVNDIALVNLQGRASLLWSVSTELALYLLFVPLACVFARLRTRWLVWLALAVAVGLQLVFLQSVLGDGPLSAYLNAHVAVYEDYPAWKWLLYHSPAGRGFEFVVGCLAAMCWLRGKEQDQPRHRVFGLAAAGFLVGVGWLWADPLQGELRYVVQPLCAAGFVFCVAQSGAWVLRLPVVLYLGELSYSTYLLHTVWLQVLVYSGSSMWVRGGLVTVYFAGTLVLAHWVYGHFEVPARRWLRAWFGVRG